MRIEKLTFYFSTETYVWGTQKNRMITYVVGTQKNPFNEMVLLSTQNITYFVGTQKNSLNEAVLLNTHKNTCKKLMVKKIITSFTLEQ